MIENLDYSIDRLKIGLIILFFVSIVFFFKLNLVFFIIVSFLIIFELYLGGFYKKYNVLVSLSILTPIIFLKIYYDLNLLYVNLISIFLILLTIFFHSFVKFLFVPIIFLILIILYDNIYLNNFYFYLFLFTAFINDTSAYLIGKNLKGPLIVPNISPNKTWTGTIGSFSLSFLIFNFFDLNLIQSFFLSLSLFVGDLYFSFIKRKENIKDFSGILLSHGGILDRLDSFLFLMLSFNLVIYINY